VTFGELCSDKTVEVRAQAKYATTDHIPCPSARTVTVVPAMVPMKSIASPQCFDVAADEMSGLSSLLIAKQLFGY